MAKIPTPAVSGLNKRVRTDARLTLPKFYPPRVRDIKTNYKKEVLKTNISFGDTGFTKEDFNV